MKPFLLFAACALATIPTISQAAPIAQARGEKVGASIDSIKSNGNGYYRVNLWLNPTLAPAATDAAPALWEVESVEVRNGGQSETATDLAGQSKRAGRAFLKRHADGSPAFPGESGLEYSLRVPSPGAEKPATADFVVTAIRRTTREFKVEGLKFPTKPGAMLAPKHVVEHAGGSRLIVWKVGRFDTTRQPLLGPYSPRPGAIKWQGLVAVMEFRPAKNVKPSPKTRFSFDWSKAADDAGRKVEAPQIGADRSSLFGGHGGDVWKVLPPGSAPGAVPPGKKPKGGPLVEDAAQMKRTGQTWYSAFLDVPAAEAKSLAFEVRVEEEAVGETEVLTLANVPLPQQP